MKDRLPNTQEPSLMDYVLQIYELCFSLLSPVSANGLMTGGYSFFLSILSATMNK